MAKVLVLYYSMYGHIETMANAVADGAKSVSGSEVTIKRVPETIPAEQAAAFGAKLDQDAAVATPAELADYDAIIFGTPTRFGNMAAQMRNFLDQTGGLWVKERWSARSAVSSLPPERSTVVRRRPLRPFTAHCCITEW